MGITQTDLQPRLVSIADAARMLGIGRSKLYTMLDLDGELEAVSIGSRRLITVRSIDRLIGRALGEAA